MLQYLNKIIINNMPGLFNANYSEYNIYYIYKYIYMFVYSILIVTLLYPIFVTD